MDLAVIGLGKLGAPLAAVLADGGHHVVGADVNAAAVAAVSAGRAPVEETGLDELIARNADRITATTDVRAAVAAADATFVIVPTPSSEHGGGFSVDFVVQAMEQVGAALRDHDRWHLVAITSTVTPGACDGPIRDALEAASGRSVGIDVGLCYSPEFIALGSVIADMTHPDFLLIGESDPRAGETLAAILRSAVAGDPPVRRMNLVNAEVAKISVNTFVTTKISYANMLSEICEQLPGADIDVVTSAIGLDRRIGSSYLRGATSYGGPCFPRDNAVFAHVAESVGTVADIAIATDEINRRQVSRLASLVVEALGPRGHVAVLGLAYKPGTGVSERSTGSELALALARAGIDVVVHDPAAMPSARALLGDEVAYATSGAAACAGADVVVIATPWDEYRALAPSAFGSDGAKATVIDCWRCLAPAIAAVAVVRYLGRGPDTRDGAF